MLTQDCAQAKKKALFWWIGRWYTWTREAPFVMGNINNTNTMITPFGINFWAQLPTIFILLLEANSMYIMHSFYWLVIICVCIGYYYTCNVCNTQQKASSSTGMIWIWRPYTKPKRLDYWRQEKWFKAFPKASTFYGNNFLLVDTLCLSFKLIMHALLCSYLSHSLLYCFPIGPPLWFLLSPQPTSHYALLCLLAYQNIQGNGYIHINQFCNGREEKVGKVAMGFGIPMWKCNSCACPD